MKKLVSILILIGLSLTSYSQYFGRISTIKLTEDFGQIFKPPFGGEIGFFMSEPDARIHVYGSIGYYRSQVKEEVFRGYALFGTGSNFQLLPTTAKYKNLSFAPITISGSLNLLDKPLTPFISLGIITYIGSFDLDTTGGIGSSSGGGAEFGGFGIKPDIGILYTHNNTIQFQLAIGKTISQPIKSRKFQYWQIGLTCLYYR